MKKFTIGILVGCLLMMTTPVLADSILQSIDVVLNGVNVQLEGQGVEVNSILYNGTTYLPMRKVAELVGKDIEWHGDTMTANIIEKKDVGEMMELDFKIYNEDDSLSCYAEKNGEIFYQAANVLQLMNEYEFYGIDISELSNNNVKFYDKDKNIIIENVPFEMIKGKVFISKDYYENTILPLINK